MSNIKSIIYIFNGRFPTEKAHGIQIAKMCEAFTRAGTPVTLMAPHRRGIASDSFVNYYGLSTGFSIKRTWGMDPEWLWNISNRVGYYFQSLTSCFGIAWELMRMRPGRETILYTRDYPTLVLLTVLGFRPVVEVHDYRVSRPSRLLAWAFARAKRVIVNSSGTQMAMHQHYQISPDKLIVCPNGVDTVFFDVTYKKSEAREKLELPIKAFIIGYAGRVETAGQSKGVNILMQAFELAQSTIPNAHLCIVGDTKSVPHWQIPLYLRSFDIAVLPLGTGSLSRTTAPIKLFEYLAAGCAIVAADASSLKEYLDDTTAVFFDPTDPENLALVLQDLSQDDQRRARLGEAARAKSELHTWNSRAKNILTLINE